MKCPNCGMKLTNGVCEYCGTRADAANKNFGAPSGGRLNREAEYTFSGERYGFSVSVCWDADGDDPAALSRATAAAETLLDGLFRHPWFREYRFEGLGTREEQLKRLLECIWDDIRHETVCEAVTVRLHDPRFSVCSLMKGESALYAVTEPIDLYGTRFVLESFTVRVWLEIGDERAYRRAFSDVSPADAARPFVEDAANRLLRELNFRDEMTEAEVRGRIQDSASGLKGVIRDALRVGNAIIEDVRLSSALLSVRLLDEPLSRIDFPDGSVWRPLVSGLVLVRDKRAYAERAGILPASDEDARRLIREAFLSAVNAEVGLRAPDLKPYLPDEIDLDVLSADVRSGASRRVDGAEIARLSVEKGEFRAASALTVNALDAQMDEIRYPDGSVWTPRASFTARVSNFPAYRVRAGLADAPEAEAREKVKNAVVLALNAEVLNRIPQIVSRAPGDADLTALAGDILPGASRRLEGIEILRLTVDRGGVRAAEGLTVLGSCERLYEIRYPDGTRWTPQASFIAGVADRRGFAARMGLEGMSDAEMRSTVKKIVLSAMAAEIGNRVPEIVLREAGDTDLTKLAAEIRAATEYRIPGLRIERLSVETGEIRRPEGFTANALNEPLAEIRYPDGAVWQMRASFRLSVGDKREFMTRMGFSGGDDDALRRQLTRMTVDALNAEIGNRRQDILNLPAGEADLNLLSELIRPQAERKLGGARISWLTLDKGVLRAAEAVRVNALNEPLAEIRYADGSVWQPRASFLAVIGDRNAFVKTAGLESLSEDELRYRVRALVLSALNAKMNNRLSEITAFAPGEADRFRLAEEIRADAERLLSGVKIEWLTVETGAVHRIQALVVNAVGETLAEIPFPNGSVWRPQAGFFARVPDRRGFAASVGIAEDDESALRNAVREAVISALNTEINNRAESLTSAAPEKIDLLKLAEEIRSNVEWRAGGVRFDRLTVDRGTIRHAEGIAVNAQGEALSEIRYPDGTVWKPLASFLARVKDKNAYAAREGIDANNADELRANIRRAVLTALGAEVENRAAQITRFAPDGYSLTALAEEIRAEAEWKTGGVLIERLTVERGSVKKTDLLREFRVTVEPLPSDEKGTVLAAEVRAVAVILNVKEFARRETAPSEAPETLLPLLETRVKTAVCDFVKREAQALADSGRDVTAQSLSGVCAEALNREIMGGDVFGVVRASVLSVEKRMAEACVPCPVCGKPLPMSALRCPEHGKVRFCDRCGEYIIAKGGLFCPLHGRIKV